MIPAPFRTALPLAAAAALASCSDPVLTQPKPPPVCRDVFSQEGVVPLADSLLVLEPLPTLSPEQEQRLSLARAQPAAGLVVVARLAERPEPMLELGHAFVFSVSIGRSFVLVGQELYVRRNSVSWYGRIVDDNGEATLVLTPEGITGMLLSVPRDRSAPTRYSFHPLGGGLHAVVCIDPSKLGAD